MDELRKNHIVQIELKDGSAIQGSVLDLSKDRVLVLIDDNSYQNAKKISELENVKVRACTNFGLKTMHSSVISELDGRNCLLIENNPTESTLQRREHVRAVDDFIFEIKTDDAIYKPKCVNISAGGIAFIYDKNIFCAGQKVELIFNVELFSKEIKCTAQIIKAHDDFYAAKYENLNQYDESKIVKRVFQILVRK